MWPVSLSDHVHTENCPSTPATDGSLDSSDDFNGKFHSLSWIIEQETKDYSSDIFPVESCRPMAPPWDQDF